jgi:hypothetical protein
VREHISAQKKAGRTYRKPGERVNWTEGQERPKGWRFRQRLRRCFASKSIGVTEFITARLLARSRGLDLLDQLVDVRRG